MKFIYFFAGVFYIKSNINERNILCHHYFDYVKDARSVSEEIVKQRNFSDVDIVFIKSITVADMYGCITYCGNERKVTASTRARKIVAIRQFWKYLKTKAHLLENNIAEELCKCY